MTCRAAYTSVLLAAAALLVTGGATATSAAPKRATFAVTLGIAVPQGGKGEVRAINRADGTVAAVRSVGRSGRFSLALPAGQYVVVGAVLPGRGRGRALTQTRVAVSLKRGQRRTKASLKARRRRPAKRKRARSAYAQELGQVTPGSVAVEIPPFTGATGGLSVLNRGLPAMLITDLFGAGGARDECGVTVLEVEHRDDIVNELELQKSPYFDQSTRVTRNFIIGDVEVRGTLSNGAGDESLAYDLRLIDKRSGSEVGRLTGSMTGDMFAAEQQLAKALNEELCKLSDVYEVKLNVSGSGDFATHSATGTLDTTISAKRAGRKSKIWRGGGNLSWANMSYSSKIGCSYLPEPAPVVPWSVTLTGTGGGTLVVEWQPEGNDMTTATVVCEDGSVPGQPGTSLLQAGPNRFQVPVAGGAQPISGGFTGSGAGWTNTGTITITPKSVARID